MSLIPKLITGFRWVSMGAVIKFGLQALQVLILAYFLSAEEMGQYSIILIFVGISQFFGDLGISAGIVHFQYLTKPQLNTLYWLNISAGLIVSFLLFFGSFLFSQYSVSTYIQLISIIFFIRSLGQQFYHLLQRDMQFGTLVKIEVLVEVINILTIIACLLAQIHLQAVVLGLILSSLAYAFMFYQQGRTYYQPSLRKIDIKACRPVLSFGVYQMGERILNYLNFSLDKIFVGATFGLSALGAYELAHQLLWRPISLLSFINGKVTFAYFSKIQTDFKLLNKRYLQNVSIYTFIAFPIYFGLLLTSDEVVQLLFGEEWVLTAAYFSIIGWLGIFKSSATLIGAYQLALGKAKVGFLSNVYQLLSYLIVFIIAAQFDDINAFLYIFVIGSIVLMTPVGYYIRWMLTRITIKNYIQAWLKNVLIGGVMLISGWYLKQGFLLDLIWSQRLAILIFFGAIIYVGLSWMWNRKQFNHVLNLIIE